MKAILARLEARQRADLALQLVALFWGMTFPLIRISVATLSAWQFVSARFLISTSLFLPAVIWLLKREGKSWRTELWRAAPFGLPLGILSWTIYQTQTLGLRTVSSGRAAFITGANVVLVPLFSPFFRSGWPSLSDWLATLGGFLGLYLLTDPSGGVSTGDLWVLACAIGYAIYMHLMPRMCRTNPDSTCMAWLQIATIGACATSVLLVVEPPWARAYVFTPEAWVGLLVCATIATIGTFWLQTRFQPRTTPQRAALIFTMEPVFAAVFGYWWLGETFSARAGAGAAVILGSILFTELWKAPRT